MSFDKFTKVRSGDRIINQLQDNISKALDPIIRTNTLDQSLIKNVKLTAGQLNIVPHTLGRVLDSYSVALHGQAIVWDTQATNKSPNLTLYLWTSADVSIDLLVF